MLGFLKNGGIYFDTKPKEGSNNAVTSGGIFKAIQESGGGGTSGVGIVVSWCTSGAIPYDGYLRCDGSSFDVDEYPELAELFPSGVLPEIADHSMGLGGLVNYSNIISTENHAMEHDGVMYVKSSTRKVQNILLNDHIIGGYLSENEYPVDGYSLCFSKGDLIRVSNTDSLIVYVRFYDKYTYIKAK